jgi:RNA polymerase sigma factor (TIGR02999 family)
MSGQNVGWKNRTQFFAVASQIMRRILVDHARARLAAKRPGSGTRVTLGEPVSGPREVDLIALDDALVQLEATDPRQARMVELRFFGGLTHEEVALALGVSLATVNREWRLTKAWLYQRVATGG